MEYEIVVERGKFVVYSVARAGFGGVARNYVAERESRDSAEELCEALGRLAEINAKPFLITR